MITSIDTKDAMSRAYLRHEASNADADMDEHKKKESIVKFVAEVHNDIEGEALVVLGTEVQQTTP